MIGVFFVKKIVVIEIFVLFGNLNKLLRESVI